MKITMIVKAHLNRERIDVLLSVVAPFVLMAESGYASGWVYAGGSLSWTDANTYLALFRGFFLEALIYAMFKLTRILLLRGSWKSRLIGLLPLAIGIVTMVVSAGLNIAWANRSGEMQGAVQMVAAYMPSVFLVVFKIGVGLVFPIAVGAFALLDVGHLVEEVLQTSAYMDDRAAKVQIAEMHRDRWMKKQEKSAKELDSQYEQIAKIDAQNMIERVKQKDYSFGANDIPAQTTRLLAPAQPAVTRILAPAQTVQFPSQMPSQMYQGVSFPANGQSSFAPPPSPF